MDDLVDVFLCHTGANKDWTRDLATRLEAEQIEDRSIRTFFDEWDIAPGANLLGRIEDGLRRARFVVVVLSPALTRAAWPTLEWQSQVIDDPTGKRGRIIPLIVQKFDPDTLEPIDIPFPLRILRYLDFSEKKRFEQQFQLLTSRLRGASQRGSHTGLVDRTAVANPAAGADAASIVDEVLLSNIFPAQLPSIVYSERCAVTSFGEARALVPLSARAPYALTSGRIYSFVPPRHPSHPLSPLLTGEERAEERVSDLLRDSDRARQLVWILNEALRQRCFSLSLESPLGQRDLYYPTCAPGDVRQFSWGKGVPLTLAKVNQGDRPLGVHHSARMKFMLVQGEPHLLVEPRYFFTTNGSTPIDANKVGRYSVQWGNREGNATVLRRVLMWPRILSGGANEISLETGGPDRIRVSVTPRYGRTNLGILGDVRDVQKLLSGEGAGEISGTDDELDAVAEAHALGQLETDEEDGVAELEGERDSDEGIGFGDNFEMPF